MSILLVAVPRTRRLCGRAVVLSSGGRRILGPFRILATASTRVARQHGNPLCSPSLPFGHPPLGSYVIVASLPPGRRRRRVGRYGRLGALVLEPLAGEAAVAGRRIVLHGGPPDRKGRLRPTRGGLRVSDRDLAALLDLMNAANAARDPLGLVEIAEASEPFVSGNSIDLPGGRQVAEVPRRRRELARRRFLAGAAVLLAGMTAGVIGCTDETPSTCPPPTSDPPDAGYVAPTRSAGCSSGDNGDDNGGFTGGGGFG